MKFYLYLLIFCLLSFSVFSSTEGFFMDIFEKGKVVNYYDEYYVVQINGTINVTNNYNSTMFNIEIPFNLDTLNIFEVDTNFIDQNKFSFSMFDPFETKTFDYEIRGITAFDPMKQNKNVLASSILIDEVSLHSLIISKLNKADIEAVDINTSDVKSVAKRRLITVSLENPTSAEYNVTSITVLKTPDLDPNNIVNQWDLLDDVLILKENQKYEEDIVDFDAKPNDVYWLTTKTDTHFNLFLNSNNSILRYSQDDLLSPENITVSINGTQFNVSEYLEHMLYVKKSYSDTHIFPGDLIEVDIRINNFAPINRNVTVKDFLPLGFLFDSGNEPTNADGSELVWQININPESTKRLTYNLKYVDEEMLGVDYFKPAEVIYDGGVFYTKRTSFIRKYIPDKKIFVQKKVKESLNDEYVVEIFVHNVGEYGIDNLIVKEFLNTDDVFREITIMPKDKGLWDIENLKKSDVWKVSYITDKNDALFSLPQIIGIDESVVMKTLIFEHVIRNEWSESAVKFIEKFGLFILIFLPLLLIILNRMRRTYKERSFKKMSKQINKLKNDSTPDIIDSIDYLRKEANIKTDFPVSEKFNGDNYKKPVSKNDFKDEVKHNMDDLEKLKKDLK